MNTPDTPDSRDVHSSEFPVPVKTIGLIEIPIQLKDGSWIKMSDIKCILCNEADRDDHSNVCIITNHSNIFINTEKPREYADLLGNQWRRTIIDQASYEAGLPVGEPHSHWMTDKQKPQDTIAEWYEKTGHLRNL
jgi:hypothetical protein